MESARKFGDNADWDREFRLFDDVDGVDDGSKSDHFLFPDIIPGGPTTSL